MTYLPFLFVEKLKWYSFKCYLWCYNLCTSISLPLLFTVFIAVLDPLFSLCRGGTMNTFPGIQITFVELIMFLFLMNFCGSQISLLKRCKCEYIYMHTQTHRHWCVQWIFIYTYICIYILNDQIIKSLSFWYLFSKFVSIHFFIE